MKNILAILALLILFGTGFLAGRHFASVKVEQLPPDTVIRVDTIREPPPDPERIYVDRIIRDTLNMPGDTVKVPVEVPIERKTYKTDDYKAEIEGYRASLLSMEVYPKTITITKPEVRYERTKPKFGVGVQVGYGIPINGKPAPYIGVGVQWNIITW